MEKIKCPFWVLTKYSGYYIIAYIVQDYPMPTQDIVFWVKGRHKRLKAFKYKDWRGRMKLCGLMKTTLLDYPGKVACTVFLGGCNLRCTFCHNSDLAFNGGGDTISETDFFEFLTKRKGLLDGVCVTGGEPLMTDEVFDFIKKIKDIGLLVKLDTNGCFPERLKAVIESGNVDYIAMDIKNSLAEYPKTVGIEGFDTSAVEKSIEIIKASGIDHEFRTTVAKGLHAEESVAELSKLIKGEKKYFLQGFKENENVPDKGLKEFSGEEMNKLLKAAQTNVPDAALRGI